MSQGRTQQAFGEYNFAGPDCNHILHDDRVGSASDCRDIVLVLDVHCSRYELQFRGTLMRIQGDQSKVLSNVEQPK